MTESGSSSAAEAQAKAQASGHAATRPVAVVLLGDVMTDLVARLDGPLVAASDSPARISVEGGGAAANTASWLAGLGARAVLLGRVGHDAAGRAAADGLRATGVETRFATDPDRPTGTVIVLVEPGGERTMVPDPGANAALDERDLPTDAFVRGAHLHLSGYTLLRPGSRDAGLAALRLARDAGMTASVDAASVGPLKAVGADRFLAWIDGVDVLFANRAEAVCLAETDSVRGEVGVGLDDDGDDDDDDDDDGDVRAAARVLSECCGLVVVKLGARGALGRTAGGAFERVDAVGLAPGAAVDTTGAGDAFAAGFLHAWLGHTPLRAALGAGCVLAARAVTSVGARQNTATTRTG
ncbi:MAG: carbohydrate kinase family protein [Actinocrinis sp.]